jgi:predicted nucleic acid-binding Zn ribbon protein
MCYLGIYVETETSAMMATVLSEECVQVLNYIKTRVRKGINVYNIVGKLKI